MINFYKKALCLILCLFTNLYGKVIIWDLGSTLFYTSHLHFAKQIGISNFLKYAILDWKSPNIKPIVFDILNKLSPNEEYPQEIATDNDGNPLPVIMERWLAGLISDQEIMKSVKDYFEHLDHQKYFISSRQRALVLSTIENMFNPESLINATKPIKAGIRLLKECYRAKNQDGQPKNTLFVLSNWDSVSFELLKKKYQKIFNDYFEANHIIISGAIGLIKPNKAAYQYVLDTYDLNPKECIFIDDQCTNILAAKSVGMTGLLLCNKNYYKIRKALKLNGAL